MAGEKTKAMKKLFKSPIFWIVVVIAGIAVFYYTTKPGTTTVATK